MIQLESINHPQQIEQLVKLAKEIWNEYFPPIIGQAQVDHMLQKFQNEQAIAEQTAGGYEYFFITHDEVNIGYVGFKRNLLDNVLELSKFYVHADNRNNGVGRQAMTIIKQEASESGLEKIVLKVNRDNSLAINAYLKYGFKKVGESNIDIGDGFIMEDWVLEFLL